MLSTAAARRALCFAPKTQARISRRGLAVRAEGQINPSIKKDVEKVVDTVSLDDLDGKPQVAYCRCWRSGTFPKCDGKHVQHNAATGDNVGPLLVKAPAK